MYLAIKIAIKEKASSLLIPKECLKYFPLKCFLTIFGKKEKQVCYYATRESEILKAMENLELSPCDGDTPFW